MNFNFLRWRSIKAQMTVLMLGIFVLSVGSLALFANRVLRQDVQELAQQQQFSTATIVAAEVEQELADRLKALAEIAAMVSPAVWRDRVKLQAFLEQRDSLRRMFNGGAFVTGLDGTLITTVPLVAERIGQNVADRDYMIAALQGGQASVGQPVLSKGQKVPVFSLAAPIRDPQGHVVGALAGIVNLGKANFLDRITGNTYGTTGGYLIVEKRHRLVVTATDKSRIMETLPGPGRIPLADRFIAGYEGSGVAVTPGGVAALASAKGIPTADWYLLVLLPTAEAMAPLDQIEQTLLWAACLVSLLAAALTWWLVRRQLAPLSNTAQVLAALPQSEQFPRALPVATNDEIGALVGGFNHLLGTLQQRESLLHESELRFRTLIEWTPVAFAVHRAGKILYFNPAALRMFGAIEAQDIVGKPILGLVHPDDRATVIARVKRSEEEGIDPPLNEERFLRLDGKTMDVEIQGKSILYDGQRATQVVMRDITEQRRAELALRQSEEKYRGIFDRSVAAIYVFDHAKHFIDTNVAGLELLRYTREELLRLSISDVDADPAVALPAHQELPDGGRIVNYEHRLRRKDASVVTVLNNSMAITDGQGNTLGMVSTLIDISERKQAQNTIEESLRDKVALLNEVHHRVKNNLQVITSLLRLEAARSSHLEARSMLQDMQGRIRSMGLLHELLYRSGTFASVDLGDYIKRLATEAFRAQASASGGVRLQLDLQAVTVSMDQATPCGLLVNELLSNALKHGFRGGRKGEIRIQLQALSLVTDTVAQWCLRVSDNGVGLGVDFEARMGQSLGLQLVSDLVRQIGGTLAVEPGPGASFAVTFRADTGRV